ncbi:hypothetical protein N2152v2_003800 [Parachlorella kessleri]
MRRQQLIQNLTGPVLYSYSLTRAPAVLSLEKVIDEDVELGICYKHKPLLPDVPEYVCEDLRCLWSDTVQLNIDLWDQPLAPSPATDRCPAPRGGQQPVGEGQPLVSFVLVLRNQAHAAAQALLELFRTAHEAKSAEYVVVDDASSDDMAPVTQTLRRLSELFGISVRFTRNEEGKGYRAALGQAVQLASGKYLVLLSSNVLVVKGWLAALLPTLEAHARTGLVGPMLADRQGKASGSPGIIFEDASTALYLEGVALHHSLNHKRRADYVPAACMVVPKYLFDKIGGFDSQYVPGCYEDVDFSLAVRAAGMDVVYQPLAVTLYQEDIDTAARLSQCLNSKNRELSLAKWEGVLKEKHCSRDTDLFTAAHRLSHPKMLWVADSLPQPSTSAGADRVDLLEKLVRGGYYLTYASIAEWGGKRRLRRLAAQLRHQGVDLMPSGPHQGWVLLGPEGQCLYDVVMVSRATAFEVAQGQIAAACPRAAVVYDAQSLEVLGQARRAIAQQLLFNVSARGAEAEVAPFHFNQLNTTHVKNFLEGPSPEAQALRRAWDVELYFIDKSNLTIVASPEEAELVREYRPGAKVEWAGNFHIVDLPTPECEGRAGVLFTGDLTANVDNRLGLQWLLTEVLPIVVRTMPPEILQGFQLHITGSQRLPPDLKAQLGELGKYVQFHGKLFPEQLSGLLTKLRAVVVPAFAGAGLNRKVIQAFKLGMPVVGTPVALEGLDAHDGVDCFIGDSAPEFARKVVQVHTIHCRSWQRIAAGGLRNVREFISTGSVDRKTYLQALGSSEGGPLSEAQKGTCLPKLLAAGRQKQSEVNPITAGMGP